MRENSSGAVRRSGLWLTPSRPGYVARMLLMARLRGIVEDHRYLMQLGEESEGAARGVGNHKKLVAHLLSQIHGQPTVADLPCVYA